MSAKPRFNTRFSGRDKENQRVSITMTRSSWEWLQYLLEMFASANKKYARDAKELHRKISNKLWAEEEARAQNRH